MVKRIEFVCTANNGKSPIALAVARSHVGKNREYALSSTGTMVEIITTSNGGQLAKYLKQFCNDAHERDILSAEEIKDLEINPREILEKFLINERMNRDKYLDELGLKFVDYPTQTHAISSEGIVACIGDSNLRRVKDIYNRSEYSPKIVNLMGEDYPDVSNRWILTYEEFREMAEAVRKSTIRLLGSEF